MISEEYIKDVVKKAHEQKIENEEEAKMFIERMKYIYYLHDEVIQDPRFQHIEIGFDELLKKEGDAWEMVEDEAFIFEHVIYPFHHEIWKIGFEYLRNLESSVIRGEISKKKYAIMIENFNKVVLADFNEEASKHHLMKHSGYWVQSLPLKIDLKKYGVQ